MIFPSSKPLIESRSDSRMTDGVSISRSGSCVHSASPDCRCETTCCPCCSRRDVFPKREVPVSWCVFPRVQTHWRRWPADGQVTSPCRGGSCTASHCSWRSAEPGSARKLLSVSVPPQESVADRSLLAGTGQPRTASYRSARWRRSTGEYWRKQTLLSRRFPDNICGTLKPSSLYLCPS